MRETLEETGIDISEASIEQLEGALSGQSEKVLRETGEIVMVENEILLLQSDTYVNS